MPPQSARVAKIAGNIGSQRTTFRPQTEVRSRQAITAGLRSPLLLNYLNKPNVRSQAEAKLTHGPGRDWTKTISSVMSNDHSMFDNIITEVEELGEKTIVDKACGMIENFGNILGRKDAKQGIAEFFEADTHGEFDPGQMLVHTWGAAHSILYTRDNNGKFYNHNIDQLPQSTRDLLKESFRKGYIFLRAAEIVSKESYYQKRTITDKYDVPSERLVRWQIFDTEALENGKLNEARLIAIQEIHKSLKKAKASSNPLLELAQRTADGFNDILPYAEIEVEFRSGILNGNSLSDSQSFPNLFQNGNLPLLSSILKEAKTVAAAKKMGLPLLDEKENLLGVIVLSLSNGTKDFSPSIKNYILTLQSLASEQLENMVETKKLKKQNAELQKEKEIFEQEAKVDGLTELMNKRYYIEQLNREYNRSARYKNPLSLLLLDIDHFKIINDNYGHQTGDKVLKELAKILEQSVRKGVDTPARVGGEEFAIILPETDREYAKKLAERIRKLVEEYTFTTSSGRRVPITVSIGVSSLKHHSNPDKLVEEADKNLYTAKRTGRNKVV